MTFREQLQSGRQLLGTWVKLPCIESVELLARAGFDFVALDLEHGTIGITLAAQQIALARALGIAPLVRVPRTATHEVTRLLDAGAAGLIFPRIGTAADARFAADQLRFEPGGTRGMGISSRAGDWGLSGTSAYLDEARRPACIAMIESAAGVAAIADILDQTGVDALLIGPADLTLALGCGSDLHAARVHEAIASVLAAAAAANVPCGIALGTASDVAQRSQEGFRLFALGNDATLLGQAAKQLVAQALHVNGGQES